MGKRTLSTPPMSNMGLLDLAYDVGIKHPEDFKTNKEIFQEIEKFNKNIVLDIAIMYAEEFLEVLKTVQEFRKTMEVV